MTVRGRVVAGVVPPGDRAEPRVDVDRETIRRILAIEIDGGLAAELDAAEEAVDTRRRRHERRLPATAAISVITLGELRAGVLLARDATVEAARRERFAAVQAVFVPLPVDEPVAERYGAADVPVHAL